MTGPLARRSSAGRGAVVSLIGSGHCYSHMAAVAPVPLFSTLHDELGVGYAALGALLGVFSIASGAGQIPAGILVDRFSGRAVLVPGIACLGAALVAAGLLGGYWPLMLMMAVAGLANSVFHPADYAIMTERIGEGFLGRAVSVHTFVGYLGWAIVPTFMTLGNAAFGWQGALIALGLLGLGIAALLHAQGGVLGAGRVASRAQPRPRPNPRAMLEMVLSPRLAPLFLYFFLISMTVGGVISFCSVMTMELFGVDEGDGNLALTLYLTATAGGVLAGGVAADRISDHRGLIGATIAGSALGLALIAFGWSGFPTALVALAASGFLMGVASPSRDLLVRAAAAPGTIGLAFGYTSTGLSIGFAVGPPAVGWLIDGARPDLALLLLAAISFCAVATVSVRRPGAGRR